MDFPEARGVFGNINSDVSPDKIPNGDLLDAHNTTISYDERNTQYERKPITGNTFAESIGTGLLAQDKIVRIIPKTLILDGQPHDITLRFYNRIATTPAATSQTGTFTGTTLGNFKTFIDGLVTASGFTYSSAPGPIFAVDYSFATEDCVITTDNPTYEIGLYTVQELITADEAGGDLFEVGSKSVGDYLYIWSANKETLPSTGFAMGEFGRATYDKNYKVWTYTRLIQSKELTFLKTKKFDDPKIQINFNKHESYTTDNYNSPKAFYSDIIPSRFSLNGGATVLTAENLDVDLSKIFWTDGLCKINVCGEQRAISNINNTTKQITVSSAFSQSFQSVLIDIEDICLEYRYTSGYGLNFDYIKQETNQVIVTRVLTVEVETVSGGGRVTSGNKRYIARGITTGLEEYNWSRLSSAVNLYSAGFTPLVVGDIGNIETGKSVTLRISNIDTNLFKYIELAVINYNGGFPSGEILKRIETSASEMLITHLGTEDTAPLDLNTITDTTLFINTAGTNAISDNGILLGNVDFVTPTNFEAFALSTTHVINRAILPNTPNVINSDGTTTSLTYGEYQNPLNVSMAGSAMLNETYRIGFRITETSGAVSDWWVDDIVFNTGASNVTAGEIWNGQVLPNRRTGTIPDFDLSDADFNPYYFYLTLTPNFNVLINGKPARDYIDTIEVVMAQVVREVHACGLGSPSTITYTDGPALPAGFRRPQILFLNKVEARLDRNFASLYFPDVLLGQTNLSFNNGDQLWVFGRQNPILNLIDLAKYRYNMYRGDMSAGGVTSVSQKLQISNVASVQKLAQAVLSNIYYQNTSSTSGGAPALYAHEDALAVKFSGGGTMNYNGTFSDNVPLYYVQYVRPVTYNSPDNCKYGTVYSTSYYPVGNTPVKITAATVDIDANINDVFTQAFHFKEMYPTDLGAPYTPSTQGYGCTFFCQNIANTQMRAYDKSNIGLRLYPNSFASFTPAESLSQWLSYKWVDGTTIIQDEFSYDPSYTYRTLLQPEIGQNPELPVQSKQDNVILYSLNKARNSLADSYRYIPPGNRHYLDSIYGGITDLFVRNTEVYALQPFNNQRLFYNERGQLQTNPDLSVIVGAGTPMNQDGRSITRYGCLHQSSVVQGLTDNGDPVYYYFDATNLTFVRFGGDGINPISFTKSYAFDTQDKTKWALRHTTPYKFGINAVFDIARREFLTSVRGQRIMPDYTPTTYTQGQVVSSTVAYVPNYYSLDKTLYKAKVSGALPPPTGTANDPNWTFVELSDTDYYSWTTFCYSEITKGLSSYYDFVPRSFIQHETSFLTPMPLDNGQNRLYSHKEGLLCRWWEDSGVYFQADPTVQAPFTGGSAIEDKKWVHIETDSTVAPDTVDFTLVDSPKLSYLVAANFRQRRVGKWVAAIRRDSTVSVDNPTGSNSLSTSPLRSKVLKVLFNFGDSQVVRTLRNIIITSRILDKKTGK